MFNHSSCTPFVFSSKCLIDPTFSSTVALEFSLLHLELLETRDGVCQEVGATAPTTKLNYVEEESMAHRREAAESNFQAEQLEKKWYESSHKLAETEKEFEALHLDFTRVS